MATRQHHKCMVQHSKQASADGASLVMCSNAGERATVQMQQGAVVPTDAIATKNEGPSQTNPVEPRHLANTCTHHSRPWVHAAPQLEWHTLNNEAHATKQERERE